MRFQKFGSVGNAGVETDRAKLLQLFNNFVANTANFPAEFWQLSPGIRKCVFGGLQV
jgi:hypothetical protein